MKKKEVRFDSQKENTFKELAGVLRESGYTVRREKLKRGPGWRVLSGVCRAHSSRLIFVDRRLSQDDQISFLVARLSELNLPIPGAHQALPSTVPSTLPSTQAA